MADYRFISWKVFCGSDIWYTVYIEYLYPGIYGAKAYGKRAGRASAGGYYQYLCRTENIWNCRCYFRPAFRIFNLGNLSQYLWKRGKRDNMKIVCIYGQNHKGSTYHIAKIPWDNPMGFLKIT